MLHFPLLLLSTLFLQLTYPTLHPLHFWFLGPLCHTPNPVGPSPAEPAVPFKKRLQDLEVKEKESATFQCEVAQPATEAAWFKEETRLWASAKYRIEEEGTERRLTVRDVSADDDAVYICETTEGSRTVAELSVQGRRGGAGRGRAGVGGARRANELGSRGGPPSIQAWSRSVWEGRWVNRTEVRGTGQRGQVERKAGGGAEGVWDVEWGWGRAECDGSG